MGQKIKYKLNALLVICVAIITLNHIAFSLKIIATDKGLAGNVMVFPTIVSIASAFAFFYYADRLCFQLLCYYCKVEVINGTLESFIDMRYMNYIDADYDNTLSIFNPFRYILFKAKYVYVSKIFIGTEQKITHFSEKNFANTDIKLRLAKHRAYMGTIELILCLFAEILNFILLTFVAHNTESFAVIFLASLVTGFFIAVLFVRAKLKDVYFKYLLKESQGIHETMITHDYTIAITTEKVAPYTMTIFSILNEYRENKYDLMVLVNKENGEEASYEQEQEENK